MAEKGGVKCDLLGTVGGEDLTIMVNGETLIKGNVEDLGKAWREAYLNATKTSE